MRKASCMMQFHYRILRNHHAVIRAYNIIPPPKPGDRPCYAIILFGIAFQDTHRLRHHRLALGMKILPTFLMALAGICLAVPASGQTTTAPKSGSGTSTNQSGSSSTTSTTPGRDQERNQNQPDKPTNPNSARDLAPGRSTNPPPGQGGVVPGQEKKETTNPNATSTTQPSTSGNTPKPADSTTKPGDSTTKPSDSTNTTTKPGDSTDKPTNPNSARDLAPGRSTNPPPGQGGVVPGQEKKELDTPSTSSSGGSSTGSTSVPKK